jgi:alkanesulfonate monooxygenase SsuD/methylene tetrahydromethanopterin reductase-like flavin-dependent oxidoreductase (luciferase family)
LLLDVAGGICQRRGVRLDLARIGILELARAHPGTSPTDSLHGLLDLAQRAEELGYGRVWIAEHHGPDAVHACPELIVGLAAARTTRIRVGAAAVLLRYYSPLKVAETFRALSAMFPGRIDLGIARGPGVDSPAMASELVCGNDRELTPDAFDVKARRLAELITAPEVSPRGAQAPSLWVLGSGPDSEQLACSLGAPYGYALFLRGIAAGGVCRGPVGALAVSVICHREPGAAARRQVELLRAGHRAANVVGTPEQCVQCLAQLQAAWSARELLITTSEEDAQDRAVMYEALAERLQASRGPGHEVTADG